uniref:YjiS-like domain-containing protein n=1 Tax=Bradyrhizobium japonicum TaxID=375 RepID=Q8RLF4_BRAJP|nr:unknown [Bradyrhizobium japonicum]
MKTHSHGVIRIVRPDDAEPDGQVAPMAWDGPVSVLAAPRGKGLADIGSDSAPPAAHGARSSETLWWAFLPSHEGFALYGPALHPTAAMPVHAILAARRVIGSRSPRPASRRNLCRRRGSDGAGSSGNVVELGRSRRFEVQPERRWSPLRSAGETLTVLLSHARREREIRRAVAALKELDDRTLRDLGIHGRSEIEGMVRYCHDC